MPRKLFRDSRPPTFTQRVLPLMSDRWRIPVRAPQKVPARQLRLFPLDAAAVRRRLALPPYQSLVVAVEGLAAQVAARAAVSAASGEAERAAGARALAFLALVRRDAALAKPAVAHLAAAGQGQWPAWVGMAQTVHDYLLAADLLRAGGYFTAAGEARLREALAPKLLEGMATAADLPQNNWRIECDCAVASAALFFWHRPGTLDVRELLTSALDGLSRMLFGLLAPDGANAEGINYSRRSAIPVIRLGWTYRHLTGIDLLNEPPLRRWWQWQVDLKRPDGRMFPLDDSGCDYEGFPHPLLVHPAVADASLHHWAWQRGGAVWPDWAVEALLVFDHRVAPQAPAWPLCQVRPESGTALFRSGWDKQATMGILVARPLPPFGADQINTAHRHDDPTNFLVHAGGKLLVTEGGYGHGYGDPERYSYRLTGLAHNLILVDGQGPLRVTSHNSDSRQGNTSQSAGRVTELVRRKDLYGALAETSYQDVDFRRALYFVRQRWFVIIDQVTAARVRRFDWLLHGSTTALAGSEPDGCVWTDGEMRLWLFNLLPSGLPWRDSVQQHPVSKAASDPDAGRQKLRRVWTAGREVTFVSVLIPGPADSASPKVRLRGQNPVQIQVELADSATPDVFTWTPNGGPAAVTLRSP